MVNKENFGNYLFWFFMLIILGLTIFNFFNIPKIPSILEDNNKYRYGWICSEYKFASTSDADKGWNCRLEQCIITEQEPLTEQCICVLNNLSVSRVCTRQIYLREYPYPNYNKPTQINITQKEFDEIISGEKNLSDVI